MEYISLWSPSTQVSCYDYRVILKSKNTPRIGNQGNKGSSTSLEPIKWSKIVNNTRKWKIQQIQSAVWTFPITEVWLFVILCSSDHRCRSEPLILYEIFIGATMVNCGLFRTTMLDITLTNNLSVTLTVDREW